MPNIVYDIRGPGLVRAIQEAVSSKKNMTFVYARDKTGHPVRVGYFLEDKGRQNISKPAIKWFSSSEVQIIVVNTPVREFGKAFLGVEFIHPKKNEQHFLLNITLDKETRLILRNVFRINKNSVSGFIIQIEISYTTGGQDIWKPVVRYDHAHGFIHRDMIASDGSKTKYKLGTQDTKDAIVLAIEEIRENLNLWLHQLGYKMLEKDMLNKSRLNHEIDKAKLKLLELHDNPEKIKNIQSTFGQFF